MLPIILLYIAIVVFITEKTSPKFKKINYILLAIFLIASYLWINVVFCYSDIQDVGECKYMFMTFTEEGQFLFISNWTTLILTVLSFLSLNIKMVVDIVRFLLQKRLVNKLK
jgi:hypothetical protein